MATGDEPPSSPPKESPRATLTKKKKANKVWPRVFGDAFDSPGCAKRNKRLSNFTPGGLHLEQESVSCGSGPAATMSLRVS